METFGDTCSSECCITACFNQSGKEIWGTRGEDAKRKSLIEGRGLTIVGPAGKEFAQLLHLSTILIRYFWLVGVVVPFRVGGGFDGGRHEKCW